MAQKNTGRGKGEINRSTTELELFLDAFVGLTSDVTKKLAEQATNLDEKVVIEAYSMPLQQQVSRLAVYIKESTSGLPEQTLQEIRNVLHLNAATLLVESGRALTVNLGSTTARIGMSDLFGLIKKIIDAIVTLIFGSVPDWLAALEELIDEILNFLLSVGVLRLASALSQRHQNYMAELTQLENLMHARAWRNNGDDDEE